jgi:hypothetical protein
VGSQYPSSPEWDEARAAWLVGKVALIGMTKLASDGTTVLAKQQYHGVIEACDRATGIRIACKGGSETENVMLPPTTTPFLNAKPGEYRLRSTGEVIRNPDVTVSWTITEPKGTV